MWSSTKEGNIKLSNAYDSSSRLNSNVYLFFSMNGSGRFAGIAKMTSRLLQEHFDLWALDDVWNGLIRVEWLVIKDIPNKFLKHIVLPNNENKPITNSRDTQEILKPEGIKFIECFEKFNQTTTILQHFQYFDQREHIYLSKQREFQLKKNDYQQ